MRKFIYMDLSWLWRICVYRWSAVAMMSSVFAIDLFHLPAITWDPVLYWGVKLCPYSKDNVKHKNNRLELKLQSMLTDSCQEGHDCTSDSIRSCMAHWICSCANCVSQAIVSNLHCCDAAPLSYNSNALFVAFCASEVWCCCFLGDSSSPYIKCSMLPFCCKCQAKASSS